MTPERWNTRPPESPPVGVIVMVAHTGALLLLVSLILFCVGVAVCAFEEDECHGSWWISAFFTFPIATLAVKLRPWAQSNFAPRHPPPPGHGASAFAYITWRDTHSSLVLIASYSTLALVFIFSGMIASSVGLNRIHHHPCVPALLPVEPCPRAPPPASPLLCVLSSSLSPLTRPVSHCLSLSDYAPHADLCGAVTPHHLHDHCVCLLYDPETASSSLEGDYQYNVDNNGTLFAA